MVHTYLKPLAQASHIFQLGAFWRHHSGFQKWIKFLSATIFLSLFYNNCSNGGSSTTNSSFSMPATPYCPYLPSKSFSDSVAISGRAVYEFRIDGNGIIANGTQTFAAVLSAGATHFSISIDSKIYAWQGQANAENIVSQISNSINNDSDAPVGASPERGMLVLTPKNEANLFSVSALVNMKKVKGELPRAIRFAEITVTDANQNIVQCAETNGTGQFTFELPRGSENYKVAVSPRANNSNLQAYVLQDPESNQNYFVSTTTSAEKSTNQLKLVAKANGSLEGGAFNILDQLARANIFLRESTSSSQGCGSLNFADCTPFNVGPLVYVYWKKGLNPGIYEGLDPGSGISYYLPGRSQLFIMGGVNGDVNFSDTDHFDNSVILHEYGHFIEDHYGKSDSPGGSHDGFSQLDPRLAWSEAWADFFQARITGDPVYRDTYGNPDGTAGVFFKEDLESLTPLSSDRPTPAPFGEGLYHEFSITRLLWDAVDLNSTKDDGSDSSDEHTQSPFAEIWSVFNGEANGFRSEQFHFRSIGLFHLIQNAKSNHTDWSGLRAMEYQNPDRREYGALIGTANCSSNSIISISPKASLDRDFFRNDRFYSYNHAGGNLDLVLDYTTPSGVLADLDLFIYPEKHYLDSPSSKRAKSEATPPLNCSSETHCVEHIQTYLEAGTYLINVNANPASVGATNFSLTIDSKPACVTN